MQLGVGRLSLNYFSFVPCEAASIVDVVGAGTLAIESCQFQNNAGLTPIVQTSIIKMSEGTALLRKVDFFGMEFNQGSIVQCEGNVTKLEIMESFFTGLGGTAGHLISFERVSEGGEFIVDRSEIHGRDVSVTVGGITMTNVGTVTVTSTTFAHLTDGTQKAALSISTCASALTLSDLIFEDSSGSDASSLFVTSSVSLTNPISNSFSATDAPISSVDGDTTTVFLSKPNPLVIDSSDGQDHSDCESLIFFETHNLSGSLIENVLTELRGPKRPIPDFENRSNQIVVSPCNDSRSDEMEVCVERQRRYSTEHRHVVTKARVMYCLGGNVPFRTVLEETKDRTMELYWFFLKEDTV